MYPKKVKNQHVLNGHTDILVTKKELLPNYRGIIMQDGRRSIK